MPDNAPITARQLWGQMNTATATATAIAATTTESGLWCTPLILPSGGVIIFNEEETTTLEARVTFKLPCENPDPIISPDTTGNASVIGFQDPFYASISPQIYVLSATTVISYILVILIFITPRTFFVGGPGGGSGFLGRRGMLPGSHGSSPIIGVGRRPLLQKIATVTVAVSLTIATADTFQVAKSQYNEGYMDSSLLVDDVVGSLEIRIIRVISDTFLWLAQVQTLIRLFPRHKEKVTIKWLGFAMVSFDTIFSILDSFVSGNSRVRPRSFQDVIPALNYLFELSISIIYASCVVYYCLSKRRFAFWHPKMKNICLVALISLLSVAIPAVFFVLDISQPDLAGWGEYIRWVGAAAASVVVWEWVERIESLERDERKDGILGREIFDGDEMLHMTPSDDSHWRGHDHNGGDDGGHRKGITGGIAGQYDRLRARLPLRKRRRVGPSDGITPGTDALGVTSSRMPGNSQMVHPAEQLVTPSRSDTGSATSTVYAIRYHNLTSPSPNFQQNVSVPPQQGDGVVDVPKTVSDPSGSDTTPSAADKEMALNTPTSKTEPETGRNLSRQIWQAVPNPFKRRRAEPPAEVADAQIASGIRRSPIDSRMNMRGRLEAFASAQRDRFSNRGTVSVAPLPITVIPAPRTNDRTWSPDDIRDGRPSDASNGPSPDSGGANPQTSTSGAAQEPGILVIPAPSPGRTWSPEDAEHPGNQSTPAQRVQRPPTAASSIPTSRNLDGSQTVYTSRGSLTISESDSRAYSSPRRSTYLRPPSTVPEESVVDDVAASEPTKPADPPPVVPDDETRPGTDAPTGSSGSSTTIVPDTPSPDEPQAWTSTDTPTEERNTDRSTGPL
ncbi:hypothetical protein B0A52_01969 [Exophiala mesophila]|uniref:PH-response regulator protein palH/RIM21 n=1 Tax=Exophiala mesophila TaxID=212818 RepID=A0A438NEI6_EXOME|nr:hypothetical protein B0A52_01969 [Exophiala mesophila]